MNKTALLLLSLLLLITAPACDLSGEDVGPETEFVADTVVCVHYQLGLFGNVQRVAGYSGDNARSECNRALEHTTEWCECNISL